jgi:hypothetical protein
MSMKGEEITLEQKDVMIMRVGGKRQRVMSIQVNSTSHISTFGEDGLPAI